MEESCSIQQSFGVSHRQRRWFTLGLAQELLGILLLARWRGASDELYPGWYVRSEQQSQRACGPQPERARRRVGICFVAARSVL